MRVSAADPALLEPSASLHQALQASFLSGTVLAHGDDEGLVLPPELAPVQVSMGVCKV